jgi:hypothetical protein
MTCFLGRGAEMAEDRQPSSPLAGKEPPEMTEGEEAEEDDAEDDGEHTESDSEARDFIRMPCGSKRGAASSSQSPPEGEALEDDEGEETTSPPEGKGPAQEAEAPRTKRLRSTVLEGAAELRRPLQAALAAGRGSAPA